MPSPTSQKAHMEIPIQLCVGYRSVNGASCAAYPFLEQPFHYQKKKKKKKKKDDCQSNRSIIILSPEHLCLTKFEDLSAMTAKAFL